MKDWIPISRKLPEMFHTAVIQFKDPGNGITIDDDSGCDIAYRHAPDEWVAISGIYKTSDILAWIPLPEGYHGE